MACLHRLLSCEIGRSWHAILVVETGHWGICSSFLPLEPRPPGGERSAQHRGLSKEAQYGQDTYPREATPQGGIGREGVFNGAAFKLSKEL